MKHLHIILVAGLLVVWELSLPSTSYAKAVNSASVADKQCSLIRPDGTVHKGKCKNVCAGRTIQRDPTSQYGSKYKCSASQQNAPA
ncbi:hypothetical protein RIVM261_060330 [Rivularia sp. IAM M-261]|nr:hypothetical protein CAL7716_035880 [Calothrix sp. PCC 7716]GJD21077.1 hypothetical protein RIVM261_060330 [Rivularia sp. IAM M-261]